MKITVEGVVIELTKGQIAQINKVRKERDKCCNDFHTTLLHFGFTQLDTSDYLVKNQMCYTHEVHGWYAEIYNSCGGEVWMIGSGLKKSSFPGGWMYGSPKEIQEEIISVLDKMP